jgi:hypothetical protein
MMFTFKASKVPKCCVFLRFYDKEEAMDKAFAEKPDYGNQVPTKFIYSPAAIRLCFFGYPFHKEFFKCLHYE